MNCLEIIQGDRTQWTKSLADQLFECNKEWAESPAGQMGWRFPVQNEFSQVVKINWKIQDELIHLSRSLDKFQESSSKEDWFDVEHTLDQIKLLIGKLRRFTSENLSEHVSRNKESIPLEPVKAVA